MTSRNVLRLADSLLTVVPRGLDRVWCCRRMVVVPLASIAEVRVEHSPARIPIGWRGPGLDFLGKLCGTFHLNSERHFWNYSGTGEALGIRLSDDQYFRWLYLSVGDAEGVRRALLDAIESEG